MTPTPASTSGDRSPPPFWTLDRVAAALRGRARGNLPAGPRGLRTISTDTRALAPGDLFVALVGEHFDAHDFLDQAVRGGAAGLVVRHPERATGYGVPVYAVDDTLRALGDLARHRRAAWSKPVIAVAGSNGKTTTKDLIRAALASVLRVHATTGNLNNLVGVPLTLLALPDDVDVAVIELGTNMPGEVERLRDIARPQLAVVTSVGEEHLQGLGSLEQVLREETAVYVDVDVAVAPAAQPEIAEAARATARRVVNAGLDGGDLPVTRWGLGHDGLGWLEVDGVTVTPSVRGLHNLRNTALALAVARECGVPLEDAARGIAHMPQPAMRLAWETLGEANLINDAYNANPPSMRAALDLLSAMDRGRQRVAVLGTMRELGTQSHRCHAEIARYALATPIEVLAGVGEMATALHDQAANDPRVIAVADVADLWRALERRIAADAIILIKASRGVRLERLVPMLQAWAGEPARAGTGPH
jgi:UDP-N-acetylmuramoyl-tripeptide--D-alanyl-D-alanine ligase